MKTKAPLVDVLINIDVADLAAAERFYCKALGLEPGRRLGATIVELRGASSTIYLLAKEGGSVGAAGQSRDYSRHWTPVHLDFVVADIEEAVASAETAGALGEGGIDTHSWGRIAQFADPWGNGFCLIEFRGRGYDEIAESS